MSETTKPAPSQADLEIARNIIAGRAEVGFGGMSDFAEAGDTSRSVVIDETTFKDKSQQIVQALVQLFENAGGVVGKDISINSGISWRDKSAVGVSVDEKILEQAKNAIVGKGKGK